MTIFTTDPKVKCTRCRRNDAIEYIVENKRISMCKECWVQFAFLLISDIATGNRRIIGIKVFKVLKSFSNPE